MTASALEALLSDQLEALPLITRASPRVRLRAGAVESDITVTTDPGASIATVTAAVAETTAKVGLGMIAANQADWKKWIGVDLGR